MKKNLFNLVASLGLIMANVTVGTSCFLGLYEPELPEEE